MISPNRILRKHVVHRNSVYTVYKSSPQTLDRASSSFRFFFSLLAKRKSIYIVIVPLLYLYGTSREGDDLRLFLLENLVTYQRFSRYKCFIKLALNTETVGTV
jgi:hypothetical protein